MRFGDDVAWLPPCCSLTRRLRAPPFSGAIMAHTTMLRVPEGVKAGDQLQFQTLTGQLMQVPIPVGVNPGDHMVVQLPAASPVPMGTPVQPRHVVSARSVPSIARYAECPICFEPLHAAPTGVFVNAQGKRVSNHFFRLDAAREWLASGNGMCPITRKPISSVATVPAVQTDPDGWFAICDINGMASSLARRPSSA